MFKEDNPRFNSTRFLKAAGILQEDWTNDEKNDGADEEVHLIASQGLKNTTSMIVMLGSLLAHSSHIYTVKR